MKHEAPGSQLLPSKLIVCVGATFAILPPEV